ncbi:MAG: DEAD/DEAH box helicase, partial [Kineosporiaceae bacterium]
HLALATGRKAFYTTPIKALSNQKYTDLVNRYGPASVGLLTGDNTVNGEAPIVVMTTEVLRNMLYAGSSTLTGLGYVVMDEVHYLADRFRGAVWEEVIIHLPEDVRLVSLSATVSNAEEFGAWLGEVRGDTEVVVSEHRPVPLWQHVFAGRHLVDLFATGTDPADGPGTGTGPGPGPRTGRSRKGRGRPDTTDTTDAAATGRTPPAGRPATPGRVNPQLRRMARDDATTHRPGREGLLPAITFVFSRAGCEAAVTQCVNAGLWLTTPTERERIRAVIHERSTDIPAEDLAVLGHAEWAHALERGLAAHHAGLLPTFKEVVEELFSAGLVKAVFATETLALGINMPARSVVLDKLVKWNGETHADVTPGEYTQLTGRAGRRGIDVEGHAVVLWQPGLDPDALAGLASTRTYPLRSSFRPTYNMAVNLVGQVGRSRAREILETSFAQFQADRAVVGLARQLHRQEEALAGYAEAMHCHLGDFPEYARLRRDLSDRETHLSRSDSRERHTEILTSMERLRRGDVIRLDHGRAAGWAVVVDPASTGPQGRPPAVLGTSRQVRRMSATDLADPVTPLTRITVPKNFSQRSPQARRDLATRLAAALDRDIPDPAPQPRRPRASAADDPTLQDLRARLRAHPCHGCTDREDHARWAERWWRLKRETEDLQRRIETRTNTVARVFDRVCDLLTERGYLDGDTVTAEGHRLRRLYTESDLLAAECLRAGTWQDLDAPALAATVSALVYESRRDDAGEPRLPAGPVRNALEETQRIWSDLQEQEHRHRLTTTPEPDLGLVWAVHHWARGRSLEEVLHGSDLAAGDFVRWCKQVIDVLGQLAQAAGDGPDGAALRAHALDAVDRVRRGVVAYSSVV